VTDPPRLTPAQIDDALRRIITEAGAVSGDVLARPEVRTLAKCVALLALVVA